MKRYSIAAIISAVALTLTLTGCGNNSEFSNAFANNPQNGQLSSETAQESSSSAYSTKSSTSTTTPSVIVDSTISEEERTHFDSLWDMFDYKKDKSEIAFMSIETDDGVQKMYIPSFEEQLRIYGEKPKVQTDGGLYAFDSTGATIAAVPNSDGSVDYQLCDGGVLQAALENKYTQVLKSGSTCLGMHLGTSTGFLELYVTGIKEVESDIGNAVKYVLERDDYRLTVYANGGNCFWFIVTIFNNSTGSGNDTSSNTEEPVEAKPLGMWDLLPELKDALPKEFDYKYNHDLGGVEITSYIGSSNAVKIPETINGDTVVKVDLSKKQLAEVILPDTVKEFSLNNKALVYANYPRDTTEGSLNYSPNLKAVYFSDGVTKIDSCSECPNLEKVYIPDSATYINKGGSQGWRAFSDSQRISITYKGKIYNYKQLIQLYDAINLGGKQLKIENGVLIEVAKDCVDLVIPEDVTVVYMHAFEGCDALKSVVIPASVVDLGVDIDGKRHFSGGYPLSCKSITSITFGDGTTTILESVSQGLENLTNVAIPDSVTEIEERAFMGCTSLESINFPSSVIKIGTDAFSGCTNLKSITIPDNTISIGYSAFSDCTNLSNIVIGKNVTEIGMGAFSNCTSLTNIVIPNNVTTIVKSGVYSSVFNGCTNLVSVTLSNKLTTIGHSDFFGCTSLESIVIPDGVTEIGVHAFMGCTSLTSVAIPDNVTKIDNEAFRNCPSLARATYKGKTYNYAHIKDLYKAINGN